MQPAGKAPSSRSRAQRDARGFERADHANALLAQPCGSVPNTGVEIALRHMQSNQGVDAVSAMDGREWLIGRAVESSSPAAGDGMAVRGSDAQVEALAQFFPRSIAEWQSGLGKADRCGAGDLTVDSG